MKVTLPQEAIDLLKEIINENNDKPNTIRIYFAGFGCSGAVFGIALDEKKELDLEYETNELNFIMDKYEYEKYGNVTITNTRYGFVISVENMPENSGGCSECSGCK